MYRVWSASGMARYSYALFRSFPEQTLPFSEDFPKLSRTNTPFSRTSPEQMRAFPEQSPNKVHPFPESVPYLVISKYIPFPKMRRRYVKEVP
ncbi:MAG: hypothetical protein ACO1N7_00915 [Sphingobacteriaceae bacterium]